jgi:sigma-E factor negative regulatory protein RseB
MRHLRLFCAVAVALGPAAAAAGDDAAAWLLQVSDAARQANYQGVVVYRDGQRMEVMRLVHRQHDGRVQERLTSLTGKPRDILREGDTVACLVGDEPVQSSGPQTLFPVLSRELLTEAATHYEYRDLGHARVAGRACRGVMMSPRDEFRYGYEICGDAETAVPLRVTLVDRLGRTIEQLMFTEVAFPERIADAAFAPPAGVTPVPVPVATATAAAVPAVAQLPEPAAAATPGAWRLVTLPPGFRIVHREQSPSPDGQGMVEHVLLSDGLSAVSVFGVRPKTPEKAFRGLSNMGAMNAYGRNVGGYHITVIGEVPLSTVRLIGDGLATATEARAEPGR